MAMTMEGTAMTDTAIEVQSGILPEKWNGRAVFTPTHLAEIFDRSLSSVYGDIAAGKIKAVRVGHELRIPRHIVERMLSV